MSSDNYEMKLASEQDTSKLLQYLEKDIPNCLYLYLDIYTYGVKNDNLTVWFQEENNEPVLVIMKYYDSFQVYSHREDCDLTPVIDKVREFGVDRVFARKGLIERLAPIFEDQYIVEYGKILELNKYRMMKGMDRVEQAVEDDIPEIVELLLTDEENSLSYTREELQDQLLSRMRTGMGCSYIIREDGKIVTHLSIAAQTPQFKVAALTMVHKDYRHTLYGTLVDSFLINELGKNNTRIFAFMTEERRIRMFLVLGNKLAAEYGKLIKRK